MASILNSSDSSISEEDFNYDNIELILSAPNWHVASASDLQYGDFIVLTNGEIIQVESVKKYQKTRTHRNEVGIKGNNLMDNNSAVQYQFSAGKQLRVLNGASITDHRIVAFEPEDDLIYVHNHNGGVHELNMAAKRSQFDLLAPSDTAKLVARCLRLDGELQLIGFILKTE